LAKTAGVSISEFSIWPQRLQFECSLYGPALTVKPDGYFRVKATGAEKDAVRSFYLELDRSTETHATLLLRAQCYFAHFRSGGFALQNGAPRSDYRKHPFRVLFILKTGERRNNLTESLLNSSPPILNHVWLTTLSELLSDPLGAIWIRPIDYRDALLSAPRKFSGGRSYRRNRVRDSSVEARVPRRRLLSA
jgi:hypothetical protein